MTQAIFLSYTSQDADAARRICDALRAAGLEVWFDQSELRGGDAWDASIKKQIKECALFVPIISANTQAREEGYFRLEWKLAVDRSHLMADNKAFFFPLVIDDTLEATAKVPDKFRERQWTRLTNDQATESFAARIAKVIDGSGDSAKKAATAAPVLDRSPQGAAFSPGMLKAGGIAGSFADGSPTRIAPGKAPGSMTGYDTSSAQRDETPSVAVLAFVNRSASADDEYFSDGLADELLSVLDKIKGLRVAARTSAFSFKGKSATVAEIGQALNVATVLEGSVRKSGNRVRISVQLVKVSDGYHLWSESYDRTLDDIFAVQDDIAQSVVRELRSALMGDGEATSQQVATEIAQANIARTDNPEAQRLCLQGRFFMSKRRPDHILRGIALCEAAIAIDGQYAAAYGFLAQGYQFSAVYGTGNTSDGAVALERMALAMRAAETALELDPSQAMPHVVLSWIAWLSHNDATRSLRELEAALALAPEDAEVLRNIGIRYTEFGWFDQAEAMLTKGLSLDPLSIMLHVNYSMLARFQGDFNEALRRLDHALALDAGNWLIHFHMFATLRNMGDFAQAVKYLASSAELHGELEVAQTFRDAFASGGWDAFLRAMTKTRTQIFGRYMRAVVHLSLGETEAAFALFNASIENHEQYSGFLKVERSLLPLHNDPRFVALLKRVGFPE